MTEMSPRRRWPWRGWRMLGGAEAPPAPRTLLASDGIDEALPHDDRPPAEFR